ncbi:MAG TPA: M4 family metallopeptidase [Thermoanaerobaculia bacterium]
MQEVVLPVARELLLPAQVGPVMTGRTRRIFDARGAEVLPGTLILDEDCRTTTTDVQALQAFRACGVFYNFLAIAFLHNSIDNHGMAIDATVHYGHEYPNAFWNGRQVVFGDGDGRLVGRLTNNIEVVAHELMHGVVQYCARLPYTGQGGALCESLADVFGYGAKLFRHGLTAKQADWLIGAGVFGPAVRAQAIRSMLHPGTAYDDPILGRDPQPAHMRDYVHSPEDNGGVHINSGIPNRAFALTALELGGFPWATAGRIWYRVMTAKLLPDATFASFARDTVEVAGELNGHGGCVQHAVLKAWEAVGIPVRRPLSRRAPRRANN